MTSTDTADNAAFELTGSIWFSTGTQNWGSQRRMALLQAIDETGSISAGARKIGLSYKAAWDAVDTMNTLAADVLVERTTGGQRGGGARLTQRAKNIVSLYHTLNEAHGAFLNQLATLADPGKPDLDAIRNLMVVAPTDNKLVGCVHHIDHHANAHDVVIDLGHSDHIVASVSPHRSTRLQLAVGQRVMGLIDASAILVGLPGSTKGLSARNCLAGEVRHLASNQHGVAVTIRLASGTELVSQITPMSLQHLGLTPGQPVSAIFKASSVIVGLASTQAGRLD